MGYINTAYTLVFSPERKGWADKWLLRHAFSVLMLLSWTGIAAQPWFTVTQYDEEDGVPSAHVTQLLQDQQGFLWFATWNGLCRYDGYEFQTFKPLPGDGCHVVTDRIRDIGLRPDGKILCRVDEDYFLFDTNTYRFTDYSSPNIAEEMSRYRQSRMLHPGQNLSWEDAFHTQWTLDGHGQLSYQARDGATGSVGTGLSLHSSSFACADSQGNLWVLTSSGICKVSTGVRHTERLDIMPQAEVKCLYADRGGHYWVTTRDGAVRIYSANDDTLAGYLGSDGHLHRDYTCFEAPVYCIYESGDGALWLGTKPNGLYRLQPASGYSYDVTHFTNLPDLNVYNLAEDSFGRLWVATLGGGLCYAEQSQGDSLQFLTPYSYPKDYGQRVRYLHIAQEDVLLAATTDGLLISKIEPDVKNMVFHRHAREPERASSLSSSAVMDVLERSDGRLLVSTESGGVNMTKSAALLADRLTFIHFNEASHHLPTDIALSLTAMDDGRTIVVGGHLVTLLDSTGHSHVLDARYFHDDYRFSDAHPLRLNGNRWLFGLTNGAFITSSDQMSLSATCPPVVLTHVSIQGGESRWDVAKADTLLLQPGERSITLHFAALEYSAPERISYAFRLMPEGHSNNAVWNVIGHDRTATLLDLKPATYCVEVRCTNADGEWSDEVRTLTIIVKPTFWESVWGKLLILLFIIVIMATIAYTLLYIRRIKRKQRETLEAYLSLIKVKGEKSEVREEKSEVRDEKEEMRGETEEVRVEEDAVLKRVMAYIDEHLSDSDANIGDMAMSAAVSRSGLQRKLKHAMGITPQDLLREARIKRACHLLSHSGKSIADVAYSCGFTDPKYFGRCFKQSTGLSPTEYKAAHGA